MSIHDMLYDAMVKPAKEKFRNSLLDGMDKCARILVVTRRLGENMNIFDSATFADILNQYAEKHYEATRNKSVEALLAYMEGGNQNNDTQDIQLSDNWYWDNSAR